MYNQQRLTSKTEEEILFEQSGIKIVEIDGLTYICEPLTKKEMEDSNEIYTLLRCVGDNKYKRVSKMKLKDIERDFFVRQN